MATRSFTREDISGIIDELNGRIIRTIACRLVKMNTWIVNLRKVVMI